MNIKQRYERSLKTYKSFQNEIKTKMKDIITYFQA